MRILEAWISYFSKMGDVVDLPPVDGFAKMVLGYLSNEVPSRETKSKVKLSGRAPATTVAEGVGAAEQTVASAAARMEIVVDFIFGLEWLCWWRWRSSQLKWGPRTFIHRMSPTIDYLFPVERASVDATQRECIFQGFDIKEAGGIFEEHVGILMGRDM